MLLEQMLKRQDSLFSSSRHETPTPTPPQKHHTTATSVGCMSGIFHLITKYQNRTKRLTSGRKHSKSNTSSSTTRPNKSNTRTTTQTCTSSKEHDTKKQDKTSSPSDVVPRSPTLKAEVRVSKSHRNQPTLVARLMGLEQIPGNIISPCNKVVKKEYSEGKRRKLLEALERCNDDLATLREVIKTVQAVEEREAPPPVRGKEGGDSAAPPSKTSTPPSDHQRLSRACVIDQRFRSPPSNNAIPTITVVETTPPCRPPRRKNPRQDDGIETYFFHKSLAKSWDIKREISSTSKPSSSKAMIQSVDQVCRDIAWGEKREAGILGLMVQEWIWKDLIEEIVQDMATCWIYVLPFEACRRRLF